MSVTSGSTALIRADRVRADIHQALDATITPLPRNDLLALDAGLRDDVNQLVQMVKDQLRDYDHATVGHATRWQTLTRTRTAMAALPAYPQELRPDQVFGVARLCSSLLEFHPDPW